ncbi:P-loop containing nucleoside triphosphate hydrolase protein [Lentinula lateritia]|uniref:P-loop containing nucleoside triphosphate hydrolase protein n=1 Tax=Lentinula aff. lateritia TaxID=2804960 RepID=A0ACC1TUV6_9AGAR|nr:P-loop containing nucleoside triphosphate hydrolase protein [Lentinula aff. lateritia]KAJ3849723.1 P-loop containing nucleoside triphosphate hydrolase protein [Lentinula lateritia]
MPNRMINIHLDNGCSGSDSSSASGSKSSRLSPQDRTRTTSKILTNAKDTDIHPLFQKKKSRDLSESEPSTSALTPTQSKKRAAGDPSRFMNSPTPSNAQSSKRQKISTNVSQAAPLAERLRPSLLADFVGQAHLTEVGSMLMNSINNGSLGSMIFWGPPGCGKTTLARLVAKQTGSIFKELSATIVGINEVRPIFEEAKNALRLTGRKTILFLDEVHRFSKSQQDVFLPFLEQGHIQLIGATTENPSFKLTAALLSRCRVFVLERLSDANIEEIIKRAVIRLSPPSLQTSETVKSEPTPDDNFDFSSSPCPPTPVSSQIPQPSSPPTPNGVIPKSSNTIPLFPAYPHFTAAVLASITSLSSGDARAALSLLDMVLSAPKTTVEEKLIDNLRRSVSASFDRSGDSRYDMISALHKSVRGSDVDAAMYWLARMLSAGEDPLYIARRMVVCASEDIGLADNQALPLAMAALQACQVIGMPECRINLAHIVAYLAEAPKSTRSYEAYNRAEAAAKSDLTLPVPLIARNAATSLMKDLGYAEGYKYNPDYVHPVHNGYLPLEIEGQQFMRRPGDTTGKLYDEAALKDWERERNGGKEWGGRSNL